MPSTGQSWLGFGWQATGTGALFKLEVVLFNSMELSTIPNLCYRQQGFVYGKARFRADKKALEVPIRPRQGFKALCSGCEKPRPGYDTLAERRFEFVPRWGMLVFLLYCNRRVDCQSCGVVVEKLPWGEGNIIRRLPTSCFWLTGRAS